MEKENGNMENRGVIKIVKGEYTFKKAFDKECNKNVLLKYENVFYSCKVDKDKLVCSDKTITDKVEVWY
ncbi:MAG: hypothetical protein IKI95_01325 [Clostridia bacterium]|nr:hypothetical protein [Clostridia bacterium]